MYKYKHAGWMVNRCTTLTIVYNAWGIYGTYTMCQVTLNSTLIYTMGALKLLTCTLLLISSKL